LVLLLVLLSIFKDLKISKRLWGRIKINQWTFRDDTAWIYLRMALVVMAFNMVKVARFFNSRLLVQILKVVPQVGIIDNPP
jgi:hypothetical protein